MTEPICCTPKALPSYQQGEAAQRAWQINPMNRPAVEHMPNLRPEHIVLLSTKWWGTGGVALAVQFLDISSAALKNRILGHMNSWGTRCNVKFSEVNSGGHVRIATTPGSGYWSYLGVDVLQIPQGQATMNLDSFSMSTPDSEFYRVVRHETGHTLGCPHEHARVDVVARIDPARAISYFSMTSGWSADMVREQVLTPLEQSSILTGTARADANSIMCYQLPGSIMKDGIAVPGGMDIDESDYQVMAAVYPPPTKPKPPEPVEPPVPVKPPVKPKPPGKPITVGDLLAWLLSHFRGGQVMDAEKLRELSDALDAAAEEQEGAGASRGLAQPVPGQMALSPGVMMVAKLLYKYLPQLFPFLAE